MNKWIKLYLFLLLLIMPVIALMLAIVAIIENNNMFYASIILILGSMGMITVAEYIEWRKIKCQNGVS